MSADALRTTIANSFDEWVDDVTTVSDELFKLVKANRFDEKKIRSEFQKFLEKVGAEGETLAEMTNCGIQLMNDQISPNRSVFWPDDFPAEKKVTKLKLGGLKLKTNTAEAEAPPVKKKGGKPKKEKKPKRHRGCDLFLIDNTDIVKKELQTDWEEKYPNVPYQSNPTAVSREIGRRWREDLTQEERDKFNEKANETNLANGVEPRVSKHVEEKDKKPLIAYQMFHKEVYNEMVDRYRQEKGLEPDTKVKPTDVMSLIVDRWNNDVKPNEEKVAEYEVKAKEYNEKHGRKPKPKAKKKKESTSKTNAYQMFGEWFRNDYDGEYFEGAKKMSEMWKEIKADPDKKEFQKWQQKADEENLRRGFQVKSS